MSVIEFEDFKKNRNKLKNLPRRRELSSVPWSDEQMRMFIKRQQNVESLLKEIGITFNKQR